MSQNESLSNDLIENMNNYHLNILVKFTNYILRY